MPYRSSRYCSNLCASRYSPKKKNVLIAARKAILKTAKEDPTFYRRRAEKISKTHIKKCQTDIVYYNNQLRKALRNNKKYSYGTRVRYKGILFMSKLEVSTAKLLDRLGEIWFYESKRIRYFIKGCRRTYIPDFYLPKRNLIIEVKPKFRLEELEVLAKRKACLRKGYDYLFCTENYLLNSKSLLEGILGIW